MAGYYSVKRGDCLASIAKKFGFSDYKTIYKDPNNADFRNTRPNPNIICEGDEIYIPDLKRQEFDRPDSQTHTFLLKKPTAYLRVVIQDENGDPCADTPYRLILPTHQVEGRTAGNGLVVETIAGDLEQATLEVNLKVGDESILQRWVLKLGYLDPVDTPTGIQARLNNLGFDCGEVDGVIGSKTKRAIKQFQEWAELEVDGIAGPKTQSKLEESHGC